MKYRNRTLVFLSVLLLSGAASAQRGSETGNGGDTCENQFKIIRDDLASWITQGGAKNLKLKIILPEHYNEIMSAEISKASISCTDEKVIVENSEKTCKNFVDQDGSHKILCNNSRFMMSTDVDRYVLVHHEYAGLAGFEVNNGASSDYTISNQLTGYLEDQLVKKLVVNKIAKALVFETFPSEAEDLFLDQFEENKFVMLFTRSVSVGYQNISYGDKHIYYEARFARDMSGTNRFTFCNLSFDQLTPGVEAIGFTRYGVQNLRRFSKGEYFKFATATISNNPSGHSQNVTVEGTLTTFNGYVIPAKLYCSSDKDYPSFANVIESIKDFAVLKSIQP